MRLEQVGDPAGQSQPSVPVPIAVPVPMAGIAAVTGISAVPVPGSLTAHDIHDAGKSPLQHIDKSQRPAVATSPQP